MGAKEEVGNNKEALKEFWTKTRLKVLK